MFTQRNTELQQMNLDLQDEELQQMNPDMQNEVISSSGEWNTCNFSVTQNEPRSPATRLCHAVAACLQNAEGALVAHAHQATQRQLQNHAALEGHKVAHVLQHKEARAVVVAVTQIGGDQGILQERNHKNEDKQQIDGKARYFILWF